jgi:hypothetical protein
MFTRSICTMKITSTILLGQSALESAFCNPHLPQNECFSGGKFNKKVED